VVLLGLHSHKNSEYEINLSLFLSNRAYKISRSSGLMIIPYEANSSLKL